MLSAKTLTLALLVALADAVQLEQCCGGCCGGCSDGAHEEEVNMDNVIDGIEDSITEVLPTPPPVNLPPEVPEVIEMPEPNIPAPYEPEMQGGFYPIFENGEFVDVVYHGAALYDEDECMGEMKHVTDKREYSYGEMAGWGWNDRIASV